MEVNVSRRISFESRTCFDTVYGCRSSATTLHRLEGPSLSSQPLAVPWKPTTLPRHSSSPARCRRRSMQTRTHSRRWFGPQRKGLPGEVVELQVVVARFRRLLPVGDADDHGALLGESNRRVSGAGAPRVASGRWYLSANWVVAAAGSSGGLPAVASFRPSDTLLCTNSARHRACNVEPLERDVKVITGPHARRRRAPCCAAGCGPGCGPLRSASASSFRWSSLKQGLMRAARVTPRRWRMRRVQHLGCGATRACAIPRRPTDPAAARGGSACSSPPSSPRD